jgi:replicative DNA helicase
MNTQNLTNQIRQAADLLISTVLKSDEKQKALFFDMINNEANYVYEDHLFIYKNFKEAQKFGQQFGFQNLYNLLDANYVKYLSDLPKSNFDLVYQNFKELNNKMFLANELQTALTKITETEEKAEDVYSEIKIKASAKKTETDAMSELVSIIKDLDDGTKTGFIAKTSFDYLDKCLKGGIYETRLYTLAAAPSVGKTALALNLCSSIAKQGKKVKYYSFEMPSRELTNRLIADTLKFDLSSVYNSGNQENIQKAKNIIRDNINEIGFLNFIKIDSEINSLAKIEGDIAYSAIFDDVKVFFVDHIGLIQAPGTNRVNQISAITGKLKQLALKYNVAIIMLSQLNRDSLKNGRMPELYDLRDSGSIEQDSNVVIMIHLDQEKEEERKIIIRKNREGKRDLYINMNFVGKTQSFYEKHDDDENH